MTILIGGGSCSGKSTFASLVQHAVVLSMDHFYLGKSQLTPDAQGRYDFDAPNSVDLGAFAEAIKTLSVRKPATIPIYDMKVSERTGKQIIKVPEEAKFLVVEGIFVFEPEIRELGDLKIYIDAPPEIRVARRMVRDVEKGRSHIDTLEWSIIVEKNHKKFVEPLKKYADIIIPFSYNPVQFGS